MVEELNITNKNLCPFLYDMKLKKMENICSCKTAIRDVQKCNSFNLVSNYIKILKAQWRKQMMYYKRAKTACNKLL